MPDKHNPPLRLLHLTLKKRWFDMIACGEKTEEYRELKPYWTSRLAKTYDSVRFFFDTRRTVCYTIAIHRTANIR